MIKNIELKNFKCYKQKKFDFSELTVFCGANSVGKSTAIQALSIPLQSRFGKVAKLNGQLVSVGFGNDIHHKDNTGQVGQDLSLSVKINVDGYILDWGYDELDDSSNKLHLLGNMSGALPE
ncbi:AAA family ATPase, partial [Vibrio cholerae]